MPYEELSTPKPPLHNFLVCDSRKVDGWAAATLPIFGQTWVEPKGDSKAFRAIINLCPLQRTALCYGQFGGALGIDDAQAAFPERNGCPGIEAFKPKPRPLPNQALNEIRHLDRP